MLHSTNIQMLQKHLKVVTFEGSFESNTFVYALQYTLCISNLSLCKSFVRGPSYGNYQPAM